MNRLAVSCALLLLVAAGGCSPPPATLDLIAVARAGLADARAAQADQHQALMKQYAAQAAALDAAFDADVRLAAGGALTDGSGKSVPLSGEWVVSARKGYIAARDAVSETMRSAQAAHTVRMDNVQAADEALDMAASLILQQQALNLRVREQLLEFQRKASNGK